MSRNTQEYVAIKKVNHKLLKAVQNNIIPLGAALFAVDLITDDNFTSLKNESRSEVNRAAELVGLVMNKVEQGPENYHIFVKVLLEERATYKEVLKNLEPIYRDPDVKDDQALAMAQPNISACSGTRPGTKQEAKASVTNGSSQTLPESCTQGVSTEQHQSVHDALCNCRICSSYLGCPNPLPAGTVFPFLEDVEGLDGRQKEELKDQLRESTESIMKAYYSLFSTFFMSLKQRTISVEDLKTHLMVLNTYNDDSKEQQSLFHDQMDTLKKASTMNAVFDVLQAFTSFVNYDLIEHLIGLLGSDEDKEGLKSYKEKFAEYAKRRLYECPSKVATSIASQCDVYVKVESRFERFTLYELGRFRKNISDLLGIKRYAIRLCCIEKGCIRLTFQIPDFVRERVFPFTSQQKRELTKLGVRQLTCGKTSYEFLEGSPLESKSNLTSDAVFRSGIGICSDCSSQLSEVTLVCKKHQICSSCFVDRSNKHEHSESVLECNFCNPSQRSYRDVLMSDHISTEYQESDSAQSTQNQMTPPASDSSVWIFVDDSNIWIEAKKLGSKLKCFKTGEDHHIRIDMGKLADVLARGRTIRQGTLYGSEPPPVDTVWSKIRDKGWNVRTSHRSIIHGKETQVHTKFVADVVSTAWSTPSEEKSTIILVTGDADIIPAIEQVLEAGGWNVEVYMWKHATSNRLKRLANDRVTIHFLDPFLGEVMYTNMVFGYNKNFGQMIKTCGVVLTIAADSDSFPGHVPTSEWISQVEELAEWPVQYYWFNHPETGRSNKLLMVFKDDNKAGKFDIGKFLKKIASDTSCPIPSVIGALSCMDFIALNQVDKQGGEFEQLGLFSTNDVYEGYQNTSAVYASSYLHPIASGSTSDSGVKCIKWKSRFYIPSPQGEVY